MGKDKNNQETQIPAGQTFYDNIFLLLVISILITGLLYNVWGLIETLSISPAG